MTFSADDHRHMARALQLAKRGLYTAHPNPRVGCVIVQGNEVVGEGWHERTGGDHAEIHALRAAAGRTEGSSVFVTLEPCCHHGRTAPCSEALIEARIGRLVLAMKDPNPRVDGGGRHVLEAAGIKVEAGLMQEQAEALNVGFSKRMREKRPYVRCKLGASLDGRTALASGESQWITGNAAREDVHRLRARSGAVVTGIGTVLADDPSLNARWPDAPESVQPKRVILDSRLKMPPGAKTLKLAGEVLIFTTADNQRRREALAQAGARVEIVPAGSGGVALEAVLSRLAELEVNEVLIEAGSRLNGAFLASGLVDEIVLYLAPCILGDAARGMFDLPGLERMSQRPRLEILEVMKVGEDIRLTARPCVAG